jgi:hypothetical protein
MLRGVIAQARASDAAYLEGYPVADGRTVANADAFTGRMALFSALGFTPVAAAGARTIMRLAVAPPTSDGKSRRR